MDYATQALTITQGLADALLTALSTRPAAQLIVTPNIHLAVNQRTPTPQDTVASWTEAAFAGYAAQALVLSAPVNLTTRQRGVVGNVAFIAGAVTASVNCFGYYLTDTTNAILYGAEQYPNGPIGFALAGDFLNLTFGFPENIIKQVLGGIV